MKITIRVYKKNKVIKRLIADRNKWRKLYSKIASAGRKKGIFKWYIKVDYGYHKDVFGQRLMFYNSGTYDNPKEARDVLRIFIEK